MSDITQPQCPWERLGHTVHEANEQAARLSLASEEPVPAEKVITVITPTPVDNFSKTDGGAV